jgi:RNA polymerase sigma-70 factor (ECF subfamily)
VSDPQIAAVESANRPAVEEDPFQAESRLIADVLSGDRKAIAQFIEEYTDVVYRFLSRRIDRREVVDDLSQEVFLTAWTQLPGFRHESSLNTWLCGIARRKAADFYRLRIRELPLENEAVELPQLAVVVDFEKHLDQEQLEAKVQRVLAELPEPYRVILRWRYWDHCSLADIAEQTGRTTKAVERLLARARTEFARKWGAESYE